MRWLMRRVGRIEQVQEKPKEAPKPKEKPKESK